MHNNSHENEFNLQVNDISFSYEWLCTKPRSEEQVSRNSEMVYYFLQILSYSRVIESNSPRWKQYLAVHSSALPTKDNCSSHRSCSSRLLSYKARLPLAAGGTGLLVAAASCSPWSLNKNSHHKEK